MGEWKKKKKKMKSYSTLLILFWITRRLDPSTTLTLSHTHTRQKDWLHVNNLCTGMLCEGLQTHDDNKFKGKNRRKKIKSDKYFFIGNTASPLTYFSIHVCCRECQVVYCYWPPGLFSCESDGCICYWVCSLLGLAQFFQVVLPMKTLGLWGWDASLFLLRIIAVIK